MSIINWLFLISLLSGTFYNVQNSVVRILLILLWGMIPILLLFIKKNNLFNYRVLLKEYMYTFFILFLLLISFIANIDTLNLEVSGPRAEKITPFLYIFYVFSLMSFYSIKQDISKKFLTYFFISVLFVLFLDMIVRYLIAPQYFLNYNTRHEAKTIGFFSTTNVNGQIIAFLIALSWQIKFQYKKILQIMLSIILITTMARAAIVSLIVMYGMNYLIYTKGLLSKFLSIILVVFIAILFIVDPMNFQHDGSLLSKIQFFESTYNLILNGTWYKILFGYGASYEAITSALDVNGWSPHVSVLKAFLYYGLFGVFIFVSIIIRFYYENKKMLIPLLIFLLFSLAGAPIFWPTLGVGVILLKIYDLEGKNKRR
jgi:hypothetical protein